jgi:arylformamidase
MRVQAMSEPLVYLDYTQAELDRAYDQRAWAANADEVIGRYASESAKARAQFKHHYAVAYGPYGDETLDIFPAAQQNAPVHVHVHGGGWRHLTKDQESFLAQTFVPAGASLVVLNFSTIPAVRLPDMMAQARRAIAWLHANAAQYGMDPERIHLSGHSSGAHMAGMLLATDWPAQGLGLPADVIKSGLVISGMYDMRPVMLSARSSYVKLSPEEILDLSAVLHLEHVHAPITVAYGSLETPEFQRQAQSFAAALEAAGKPVRLLFCEGINHFEILELLADAATPLARAALETMGLRG